MCTYDKLFEPFKIHDTEIKNRVVMCAMGGTALFERGFNTTAARYYVERAKGGVGLIIPGISQVKDMWGRPGWLHEDIATHMDELKELMNEIHRYDCKLFLQIGAGMGRCLSITSAMFIPGCDTVQAMNGPSENLPNVWVPEKTHRALTVEEIHAIVEEYGKCAALLKEAGVDGIEVHAVHEGYLLDQFAIESMNWRTDEYGGSLENRLRFAMEIVKEIKAKAGEDYPVSMRYSAASKMKGFNSGALPNEAYKEYGRSLEESPKVAMMLEEAGYDMLNVDNGTYDSWYWAHPPMYMPPACNLSEAKYIKNFVNIPVCCAGRMENLDVSYPAIRDNHIDALGVARQFLAEPHWPNMVKDGRYEDVKPCISCHNACFGLFWGAGTRCVLNPAAMKEEEYIITKSEHPKKIAVIGGGIGGMEAAMVCAKRGHSVDLYEKTNELGGVFIAAAAPEFKESDKRLIEWYRREIQKFESISIHMNAEIDLDHLEELHADEYIIAVGATRRTMQVPGAENTDILDAIEYLRAEKEVGNSVAVIGGGLTGCEIAYDLALKGKKVSIVEMQDSILNIKELAAPNSTMLKDLLCYYNVDVITSAAVKEISSTGLRYEKDNIECGIKCDSIIASIGYNSRKDLKEKYESKSNVHIIGDSAMVGNLKHVVWAAWDLCKTI